MHALGPDEIIEMMKLENITDRKWSIVASSAKTKEGLDDGFDWIIKNMKKTTKN